ncbi:hypothetical protein [Streptomyces sp. NPDC088258]|uniref:hypothetical protein n=1 Tax=Streptomyces sp. NPDC088258 TaxID=3365849 RepID=UPI0037F6E7F8
MRTYQGLPPLERYSAGGTGSPAARGREHAGVRIAGARGPGSERRARDGSS